MIALLDCRGCPATLASIGGPFARRAAIVQDATRPTDTALASGRRVSECCSKPQPADAVRILRGSRFARGSRAP